MMKEVDSNNDGEISFDEFVDAMNRVVDKDFKDLTLMSR